MLDSVPDYCLIAELLGFGTGAVLSTLLALLVRRASQRSPGTWLLVFCALLWNVAGLVMASLMLSGRDMRTLRVGIAQATYLPAEPCFPISFLLLWSRPLPGGSWRT